MFINLYRFRRNKHQQVHCIIWLKLYHLNFKVRLTIRKLKNGAVNRVLNTDAFCNFDVCGSWCDAGAFNGSTYHQILILKI